MKKLIVLTFFSILLFSSVFLNLAFAGSSDVWAVCGSSDYPINTGSKTISGTTYYCCPGPVWQRTSCPAATTTTSTTTTTTIPPGTTTTTIPSTTTTTIPPSGCNNNTKCEFSRSETQDNCPQDCYTKVYITPSSTYPGQEVIIKVYFDDSRFDATKDAKIRLEIDGSYWNDSYCPINEKRWKNDMNCGGSGWSCKDNKCSGTYNGKSVNITRLPGYGSIEAVCVIPRDTGFGTHKLKATPTIYSVPITLRAAEAEIKVGDGLYNFVLIVKRIFSRLTGFFLSV
jgi:hypothetical protein